MRVGTLQIIRRVLLCLITQKSYYTKTEQNSPMWQNKSFTVAMLCNCLLTRRNAATLFARFLRGVVRQGYWRCLLAPLEMGVLLTIVQPEWTDYAHQEQTNKHYYEHPRIRKPNVEVQCCAIGFCKSRPRSSFPIGPTSRRHFGLKNWESFA